MIDFKNFRFEPFTEVYHPATIVDEVHTVGELTEQQIYGVRLNEIPMFDNPSTVTAEYESTGTPLVEVPRSQVPQAGQFRVDYYKEGFYGTGIVQTNPSDSGVAVVFGYKGLGTAIKTNYREFQGVTIPANLLVTENFEAEGLNFGIFDISRWDCVISTPYDKPPSMMFTSNYNTDRKMRKDITYNVDGMPTKVKYHYSTDGGGGFDLVATKDIVYTGDYASSVIWS